MKVDILKPIIAGPNTCCSETYLVIGPFENLKTVENVQSYVQTKFFHFFLGIKKITQHTTAKVYELIPMQDFSKSWTDVELYEKYNLTVEEISTIENMVFGGSTYGDKI
jgi:transketolase